MKSVGTIQAFKRRQPDKAHDTVPVAANAEVRNNPAGLTI